MAAAAWNSGLDPGTDSRLLRVERIDVARWNILLCHQRWAQEARQGWKSGYILVLDFIAYLSTVFYMTDIDGQCNLVEMESCVRVH